MDRLWRALGIALVVAVAGACLDDSITGTRELTLSVTVDENTALVDSVVTARYSATGTGLLGVVFEWGDGMADTLALSGTVVVISGPVEHTYTTAGTFSIIGTIEAQNGIISDTATIQIN